MADEPKPNLSEPTKTEIWQEVERRFEHPPAEFIKLIEDEVEERVAGREKHYKSMGTLFVVLLTLIGAVLGYVSFISLRGDVLGRVESLIATNELYLVNQRIKDELVIAQQRGRDISNAWIYVTQNQQGLLANISNESARVFSETRDWESQFSNRVNGIASQTATVTHGLQSIDDSVRNIQRTETAIRNTSDGEKGVLIASQGDGEQIKQLLVTLGNEEVSASNCLDALQNQDDVVLVGDLPNLFVYQTLSKVQDGKIVLDYEPIPESLHVIVSTAPYLLKPGDRSLPAKVEGRYLIFTNNADEFVSTVISQKWAVEYLRAKIK
jgi:hypothetical protein